MPVRVHVSRVAAIALGSLLALVPFARYRFAAPHSTAHGDHAPRHGGVLGMVGDLHVEVVRRSGVIEVHPSDAYRRPLIAVGGRLELPGGATVPLVWQSDRLVGRGVEEAPELTCSIQLADGRVLRMTVEF